MYEGRLTCACGCGEEIVWKPRYRCYGIPEHLRGHHMLGRKLSAEVRTKLSNSHKGRKISAASREKISQSNIRYCSFHPEECTRRKLRMLGDNNPQYGKHLDASVKEKISTSLKSIGCSSRFSKGFKHKPESVEKIRQNTIKRWNEDMFTHCYKNTSIEIELQEELRERGIEFITHNNICGHPDIFIRPNICIFADGDYYHGPKRPDNQDRDLRVNQELESKGYKVYRFWEHEIHESPVKCIDSIGEL